jgi:XTP/dITP diphosphohydrolase
MDGTTTLIFVTGNRYKFEVAQAALHNTGIVLAQERLAVPELQSNSVQEIAEYSAQWVSQRLDQPFIVQDAGFYIDALNGFPGPFIKYVNQWFSVEDLLRLMHDKPYRHITIHDCLVYGRPGAVPVTFLGSYQGTIATTPGQSTGTPIERLYVPQEYDVPISELSPAEQRVYWQRGAIWQQFRSYYTDHAAPDNSPRDQTPA